MIGFVVVGTLIWLFMRCGTAHAKGGGGGGDAPYIPPPTPIPQAPTVAKSVTARESEAGQAKRARGNKSTVLTSGLGLGSEANTSKPTLLGQ